VSYFYTIFRYFSLNGLEVAYSSELSDSNFFVLYRSAMEGHAVHTESCLHIQQDENNVCVGVRLLPTAGKFLGAVLPTATGK
jgi:hypothetical protein